MIAGIKKCSRCKQELPVYNFRKDESRKSGLRYTCKTCDSAISKLWNQKNPDKARSYVKKTHEKYGKKYYQARKLKAFQAILCK